jgi:hypothetical protein
MATQALKMMGPARFSPRRDIVDQLRVLANDEALYAPLRQEARELVRMVQ